MQYASDLANAVGNTPLIKLRHVSEETGCTILGKAEFLNPGQSVKDRAALYIIRDAIERGTLKPGGTIVEGTAGNTGIGLALFGASMGFKTVIVIPETQSQEKKDMLRLAGAELVQVPAAPYKNPNNYVRYSQRLADELAKTEPNGAIWANQFDNTINTEAHIKTTAQEIWNQTAGKIHGFVCAVGTGGTLAGTSIGLKEKNKNIKIALSDPMGSALFSHIKFNKLESSGNSITEGIGTARITKNFAKALVDQAYQIDDVEALNIIFKIQEDQKISLGGSSGINIAGAIRLAKELGPGHNIITILCDSGKRYASKLYNKEFLKSKNLPIPSWL